MEFVARHDWSYRGYKKRSQYRGAIRGGVGHWPGTKLSISSQQDEIDQLNNILRYHLSRRYYDIAYSFAFGRFGHVYELRGGSYQSGAHSPLNGSHEAYLFLVSTDEPIPQTMLDTAKQFIGLRRAQGVGSDMKAHSDIKPTACPGGEIKTFMATLNSATVTPPTPKPTPKPPLSSAPRYPGLSKRGSKGNGVKQIQARLNARGWKHQGRRLTEDGIFGAKTEQVVRWFQADKRLVVDGLVGPATWRALWDTPIT